MQERDRESIIEELNSNLGWIVEIEKNNSRKLKVLCMKIGEKIYYGNIDGMDYHLDGREVKKITKTTVVFE